MFENIFKVPFEMILSYAKIIIIFNIIFMVKPFRGNWYQLFVNIKINILDVLKWYLYK